MIDLKDKVEKGLNEINLQINAINEVPKNENL